MESGGSGVSREGLEKRKLIKLVKINSVTLSLYVVCNIFMYIILFDPYNNSALWRFCSGNWGAKAWGYSKRWTRHANSDTFNTTYVIHLKLNPGRILPHPEPAGGFHSQNRLKKSSQRSTGSCAVCPSPIPSGLALFFFPHPCLFYPNLIGFFAAPEHPRCHFVAFVLISFTWSSCPWATPCLPLNLFRSLF